MSSDARFLRIELESDFRLKVCECFKISTSAIKPPVKFANTVEAIKILSRLKCDAVNRINMLDNICCTGCRD